MKSYTFKVKLFNANTIVHETILSIHMPLEAFFESVKQTPHLKDFAEKNPETIVTCSDYYYYTDKSKEPKYLLIDKYFCKLRTLVSASSLKSLLVDDDCCGTLSEYPILKDDDLNDPVDGLSDDVCEVINNEQIDTI